MEVLRFGVSGETHVNDLFRLSTLLLLVPECFLVRLCFSVNCVKECG